MKRWEDKLWNLVKDIPKFRAAQSNYQLKALDLWQRFYIEFTMLRLSKTEDGYYLDALAGEL